VEKESAGKWEMGVGKTVGDGSPKADSDRPLPRDFSVFFLCRFSLFFFVQELLIINSF